MEAIPRLQVSVPSALITKAIDLFCFYEFGYLKLKVSQVKAICQF